MTTRERFQRVMSGDPTVDRSPVFEWASLWDQTLRGWEKEGMPKGLDTEGVFDFFGLDKIEQFWFSAVKEDCPRRNTNNAIPIIIEDEKDYRRLKHYFYPEDAAVCDMNRIRRCIPRHESGEIVIWYTLEGFFWFPRSLFGDEAHLYSFYDYPELYHEICEELLEWHIRQVDLFAKYIKADFMTIAEDMGYNNGPMISRDFFDEFILPYYKRLIPEIKKHGTKVFVDSDGDVSKMLPWLIEAGVDGILPLERQAGVDLAAYREQYPDFLFLGGFDKMCMLKGKEDIKKEFDRLLPVIESGKYLLGMDHQTPPGTSIENYRYYVKLLKEYSQRACKGCSNSES